MLEYIKRKQKRLDKKRQRAAELEAKQEADRVAIAEAEARKQAEIVAHKKFLLEQKENERYRQKHIQRKEKLIEQKWSKEIDTLFTQIDDRLQKDDRLEEIRTIIERREPLRQKLDWATWLSDPLNQLLADLDYDYAVEMFKRDNLMAAGRSGKGGRKRRRVDDNYALVFSGDTGASGAEDYVTTTFNPDDYNLNLGCTVSYWVRPDAVGSTMFAFGRKHSNSERFCFGINQAYSIFIGLGGNRMRSTWTGMGVDTSLLEYNADTDNWDLKTDGTWYHFAVTYADRESTSEGGVARKVYLNGVLIQEANINWSSTGGGTAGMIFGGRRLAGTGYNNGWACALSQVAIFDTAKDADWAAGVYDAGRTGTNFTSQSGLVGYWKFNKGSGTTVTDYSENGNDGTFAPISGDTTAYPTWEKP